MAVLGVGGRLELKREAPEACVIYEDDLNFKTDQLLSFCDAYLTGDHVTAIGLPIQNPTEIWPTKPEGYATFEGGKWYVGPNRNHIENDEDSFYKSDDEDYPTDEFGDDAQFYSRTGDSACQDVGEGVTQCQQLPGIDNGDYWIHINELGYVSFYRDRCQALLGCPDHRVDLINVGGPIVVAPYGSGSYNNAVAVCYDQLGAYDESDINDSITLDSICDDAPLYQVPEAGDTEYDNANVTPRRQVSPDAMWQVLCEIRNWTLELEAPSVDTQGVGEKFGNSIKSVVGGGGTMEYFIDRKCLDDCQTDALQVMQLLLMTEQACKISARFWLLDRGDDPCAFMCGPFPGEIYYESDLLITRNSVNVRPTDMVVGSAQFVTVGEIKLLIGPNSN